MPVLWRYLLSGYLRTFFLSVSTFIAVLLVSRFKEIARFTALSANWGKTALFAAYQIPFILPIALPISALIASILLFQHLSRTFEITALRAAGRSVYSLLTPLLVASLFLSLFNGALSAEISPYCRRAAKMLFYQETSVNPLLLLQRQNLVKLKNVYLNMQVKKEGKLASDLILISPNESHQRLGLLSAKELLLHKEELLGKDVAILSHLHSEKEEGFDSLVIENQARLSTEAPLLSLALKKKRPRLEPSALNLRMLLLRTAEEGKAGKTAYVEILRRASLTLAVFSLTLLGAAFAIECSCVPSKKGITLALTLTLLMLVSYLLGKELKNSPQLALLALLSPHLLIWLSSALRLRYIARGR